MRELTCRKSQEVRELSSWSENIRSYLIIGCVTLILYWPIWWWGQASQLVARTVLWKAIFYFNLLAMWISWVLIYLVIKCGRDLQDDATWIELLKSLCFLVAMLTLMDLPLMISQL